MPTIRVTEDTYEAIDQLGGTFSSADDIIRQLLRDAGHDELLEESEQDEQESEETDADDFEERFRRQFDLGDSVTADDAVAVAWLLREGAERPDAFRRRADDRGVNASTVRENCKRSLGVDTAEEFEHRVKSLGADTQTREE